MTSFTMRRDNLKQIMFRMSTLDGTIAYDVSVSTTVSIDGAEAIPSTSSVVALVEGNLLRAIFTHELTINSSETEGSELIYTFTAPGCTSTTLSVGIVDPI